jgi:hypothetical protein
MNRADICEMCAESMWYGWIYGRPMVKHINYLNTSFVCPADTYQIYAECIVSAYIVNLADSLHNLRSEWLLL